MTPPERKHMYGLWANTHISQKAEPPFLSERFDGTRIASYTLSMAKRKIELQHSDLLPGGRPPGATVMPKISVSVNLHVCSAFSVSTVSHLAPSRQNQDEDLMDVRRAPSRVIPTTTATSYGLPRVTLL